LANENISLFGEIPKYPLTFVLNYLTYMKDLNEIKMKQHRKAQQQIKAIL